MTAKPSTSASHPVGPALPLAEPVRAVSQRLAAGIVLAACLTVLGVAYLLTPDPRGMGTHEQLRLPPCGFLQATGYPCASCGMTTAFTLAAHGHMRAAFHVQPGGAILAVLTAAVALVCAWAVLTGASLTPLTSRLLRVRTIIGLGVIILLAWAYKVAQVRGWLP